MSFPELRITVFSSVQSLSHVRLCDPMDCSTPGFPVQHELLEPAQIHVHQVGDAIQPSHPLSSPSPPAFSTVLVYVFCPPAAAAKSHQSCPTLCDLIDGSPPGSSVPGILLARTMEWVAISFSNAWKWRVKVKSLSRVRLLGTSWTVAYQAPPSVGFPKQEWWSGVPLPSLVFCPRGTSLENMWYGYSFCNLICLVLCESISPSLFP